MYHYGAVEEDAGAYAADMPDGGGPTLAVIDGKFSATRVLDIFMALALLLITLPVLIFIVLTIKMQDGGPVFFTHRRVGRGGRDFSCLKFRSMVVDAEPRLRALLDADPAARREWAADQKLRDDPRVTPFGVFLRRTSLDEVPQMLNVLRGDMSIVGPRPIVRAEIVRYGRAYAYYCRVRPGITGLWQVSGRNNTSYRRRVALDRLYAKTKCLSMDIAIIAKTVPAVLLRNGSC